MYGLSVTPTEETNIMFVVLDPLNNIVYLRRDSKRGIIVFDTTIPGEYTIIISNMQNNDDIYVYLGINTFEEVAEPEQFELDKETGEIKASKASSASIENSEAAKNETMI